jgi:hypothetical protein
MDKALTAVLKSQDRSLVARERRPKEAQLASRRRRVVCFASFRLHHRRNCRRGMRARNVLLCSLCSACCSAPVDCVGTAHGDDGLI